MRRRRQGKEESKTAAKASMNDQKMYSPARRPPRACPGATEHRATFFPTATTLPATHPVASSPTTTTHVAEGTGFTSVPDPTHGVDPFPTVPPMAHSVSKPVASGCSYVGIHEPTPYYDPDAFRRAPIGVPLPTMPVYTMPEHGFTSLSALRGPESCGGRSRGSGTSSYTFLIRFETKKALSGVTANLVGDLTQEIRAKLEPLLPPQGSPMTVGADFTTY